MKEYSRRQFLKGAAMGAAELGLMGAFAPGAYAAGEDMVWDRETEVLVIGAGVGGCTAAMFAARQGAEVTVVEAAPEVGGTALMSGGGLHTWDIVSVEDTIREMPLADRSMAKTFVESWAALKDYLLADGAPVKVLQGDYPVYGSTIDGLSFGAALKDKQAFFSYLLEGSQLLLNTRGVSLCVDAQGAVTGALCVDEGGALLSIGAKKVIIASGSFCANRGLVEQCLGRWADQAVLRCSPHNLGDGLRMAMGAGALMSRGAGHFYGHLVPWPPIAAQSIADYDAGDKAAMNPLHSRLQSFSTEGLAVNVNGLRYADEAPAKYCGDNYLANETLQQIDGHCWVIIDSGLGENNAISIEVLEAAGAVIERADTLEELAEKLAAHGVNSHNLKKTLSEYVEAAASGTTGQLRIPKSPMPNGYLSTMQVPPFYGVQASAGLAGMYGGIEINERAEVLGFGAAPIENLYAVPMAAGGVFYKEYAGALAMCAAFGMIAGENAGAATKG